VKGNNKNRPAPDAFDIWLIEDNQNYRQIICEYLSTNEGMTCSHAFATCEEALDKLNSESPPDVILLDLGLPCISGLEGIPQIKALSPNTFIVVLTVFDDEKNVFTAVCAGASGYLLKNAPAAKIIEGIEEVLSGGATMSPEIARKVFGFFQLSQNRKELYNLTTREKEVLQRVIDGLSVQQISDEFFLSPHTVKTHLKNIYSKLHVNSRTSAVAKALREGLL
jgi:DNA-binding NarL/FixJ family response regulator